MEILPSSERDAQDNAHRFLAVVLSRLGIHETPRFTFDKQEQLAKDTGLKPIDDLVPNIAYDDLYVD